LELAKVTRLTISRLANQNREMNGLIIHFWLKSQNNTKTARGECIVKDVLRQLESAP